MKKITLNNIEITYTLTKSRRKSLAIQIKPDMSVHVKAPYFVSQREIESYISRQADWIFKNIDRYSQRLEEQEKARGIDMERQYISGETLLFLGKDYTLIVAEVNKKRPTVRINELGGEIILGLNSDKILSTTTKAKKAIIESWYRKQAKEYIHEKVAYFAQILDLEYGNVRIKDQKSLWGSCSAKGNLNFNWRIILAPEVVVDYLVIHELCHLRHMNHSADFWRLVESLQPKYKYNRKWLKDNTLVLKSSK